MAEADQQVRVRALKERGRRIVCPLPNKQRLVYRHSCCEGRNTAEISARISISPRTVEAHLLAGRNAVRSGMKAPAS